MKMTDIVTNFPPQTYSSSFFINRLGDESGSKSAIIHECGKETQTSSNLLDCFITKIAESKECKETGRVRVFESLVDFQNNKIGFNPDDKNFQGNEVVIDTQTDVILKNSFIALESDFIFKMNLENQKIAKLEDNAFYLLTCLSDLSLYNNRVEKFGTDVFLGLEHLRRLNLGDNMMKEVPEYALGTISNLKVLNLTRNHISLLHKHSFAGMARLEVLDLSHNNLYQIIPEAFQYFLSLTTLQMGSNDLVYPDADEWTKMKQLKVLNLTDNALERFDLAYDFAFSSTLKELYLGDNFLTLFNVGMINISLPSLGFLDISDNPWSCLELRLIIESLNKTAVKQIGTDDDPEEPTINGISCNKSLEWYKQRKSRPIYKPTTLLPTDPSTEDPDHEPDSIIISNSSIMNEIYRLNWTIFWLFGLVFIYILLDIFFKTGFCKWVVNRVNGYRRAAAPLDGADQEYFSLNL